MSRPEDFGQAFEYREYLERVKAHTARVKGKVQSNSGPSMRLGKTLSERAAEVSKL